jgi:hypothetical protein
MHCTCTYIISFHHGRGPEGKSQLLKCGGGIKSHPHQTPKPVLFHPPSHFSLSVQSIEGGERTMEAWTEMRVGISF